MPKRKDNNHSNDTNLKKKKSAKEVDDNIVENKDNGEEDIKDIKFLPSGDDSKLKIMSWNVNGIRAVLKKNAMNDINSEDADIVCLQELKCQKQDIPEEINVWAKYKYKYYNFAKTKGYSGVSVFSKVKPIKVENGIGIADHDSEGRVITAEFNDFYLVNVYVPNSGRGLVNLEYRRKWNTDFKAYLKSLDQKKGLILCGDLNVSHKEIDLENPKTNQKTAGFTPEEREDFTELLSEGFVDSFRRLYPDRKKCYTFWSYLRNSRQKDIGWRLDYFVMSDKIIDKLSDNEIRSQIMGSDHCPIVLTTTALNP